MSISNIEKGANSFTPFFVYGLIVEVVFRVVITDVGGDFF